MAKKSWMKKAVGEISKLRQKAHARLFGGKAHASYTLDSKRVDYPLARELYHNTAEDYKLGAGFVKPIVNTVAAFTGLPEFVHEEQDAKATLDSFREKNVSKMMKTQLNALREGDCFVMLTRQQKGSVLFPEDESRIKYTILPPEQIEKIVFDPLTREPLEYVLASYHSWEENGSKRQATVRQRISAEKEIIEIDGDTPPDIEPGEHSNKWGFIPIVHFKNESDELEGFGRSEAEPIEPFLKAYHDVMLHAIQGSKMHSTPKLKLKLTDVDAFLSNNFGIEDAEKELSEGKTIDLEGHELIMLQDDEDAGYVEVRSAIGDAAVLLKLLFYMIVDTSEVPEFAFGVHTPSSQASVKEQMPILIRRIERKREQFEESWQLMARMVLAMTALSQGIAYKSYAASLKWESIDPRDSKEIADEIFVITQALKMALEGEFMSLDAAVKFLSKYIDTMLPYETEGDEPDEKQKIMTTRLSKMRLEDDQFLQSQKEAIDKLLKGE
ncbi:phage portal protein [Alkalihalobacillus alcalophilus ATCC 27647 = CGMCC 1.3604]|uniref:Phage portal protein n=1 Tax=Alkalihalobacillus alcalophilus ATCC 27647 = CGMCC 1.3604 TaxID=1218173 RepID=A0A094WLP0_ALKAL|nr:phage portal protein [Alkalihalobacillus alcalophilus]YP_009276832.1 portal protein [Bacillus phage BalMu-1]AJA42404.1 hypothetical protein BalMu1_B26 [Bacillus phage BalMu-1]AJA42460.1 hypothetical protein BalMu1_A26 [Bacillus phage BalMu-1]KGA96858.1 phage portal protein [Alkalihalobacillus alcalophilus ATCC 27647 = CGMCC 1.3604]MED1561147.1 phage portal protein [Alkalihalobacillus alcalophilus]THG91317.1 phage portal protein [Alkalihalobacillus alcalophilus ATCC 27647 = CGMCC 1.3604]